MPLVTIPFTQYRGQQSVLKMCQHGICPLFCGITHVCNWLVPTEHFRLNQQIRIESLKEAELHDLFSLGENDLTDVFIDAVCNFSHNNNHRKSWGFGDTFYRRVDHLAIKVFIHGLIHSCVFRWGYMGQPYFQVSFNESRAYLGHFPLILNIHKGIVSSPQNELLPALPSGSSRIMF